MPVVATAKTNWPSQRASSNHTGYGGWRGDVFSAESVSLLVQGLMVLRWVVVARGVGLTLPAELFLVGVPLVTLATMLPLSLAGLGVREWAWVAFLTPFGVAAPDAVALSLTYFACPLLSGLTGGLLFALRGAGPGLSGPERPAGDTPEAAAPRS